MITGYVSLKVILAKLYRDLGINSEINESDVVEWIDEALKKIGAYSQYEEVPDCLTLINGKAKLPCGFYKLVDINWNGYPIHWATNTNAHNYGCESCKIPSCDGGICDLTFYINDSYIITNINTDSTAKLCIVYLATPTDEEGYPMIPDNVYYFEALAKYVTYMLDYQDWRKGKVTDKVFEKSERDWLFYVNSARGSANMPNTAQLENLKNVWRRLIPNTNAYDRSFIDIGKKEKRNLK